MVLTYSRGQLECLFNFERVNALEPNNDKLPKCVFSCLFRMGLLFLFVAALSVTTTLLSHDPVDLLLGAIICLGGAAHIYHISSLVKRGNVCIFEGVCIGSSFGGEM